MEIITVKSGTLRKAKKTDLVVSALIRDNGRVLLVKRKKNKSFPGFWGVPTGKVNPGEELEEAIKREVKEDTNLRVEVLEPYHLTQEFHDDHHHIVIAFKVKAITDLLKAGSDAEEVRWFLKDEVSRLKLQPTAKEQLKALKE
jgi:8-oxo-dGTP diphosphatase